MIPLNEPYDSLERNPYKRSEVSISGATHDFAWQEVCRNLSDPWAAYIVPPPNNETPQPLTIHTPCIGAIFTIRGWACLLLVKRD